MLSLRKKDFVHDEILQRLLTRQYRFGDRISVVDLTDEIGVSRQPIMTALNALSAEGFVNIIPQVGCEVVSPSRSEIGDFYLMFGRLEGAVAELAAERHTGAEIMELQDINGRISTVSDKAGGPERYRKLNIDFHGQLHGMAHSLAVQARQGLLFAMADFFVVQTSGFSSHIADAAEEHQTIINALRRRNVDMARMAAEMHIRQVAGTVDAFLTGGVPVSQHGT